MHSVRPIRSPNFCNVMINSITLVQLILNTVSLTRVFHFSLLSLFLLVRIRFHVTYKVTCEWWKTFRVQRFEKPWSSKNYCSSITVEKTLDGKSLLSFFLFTFFDNVLALGVTIYNNECLAFIHWHWPFVFQLNKI